VNMIQGKSMMKGNLSWILSGPSSSIIMYSRLHRSLRRRGVKLLVKGIGVPLDSVNLPSHAASCASKTSNLFYAGDLAVDYERASSLPL
ncbi:uncharacterized protein A4U43_C06F14490, partial [Asparagus officinalis]